MKNKNPEYTSEVCPCCNQTTSYIYGVDKGTVNNVKKIARFIAIKGINVVHPRKEKVLTTTQWSNLARARAHGLIAKIEGERGNFCLTTKGVEFLRGRVIPKFAIMSKSENRQVGYLEPEKYNVKVSDFNGLGDYWEGFNYEITEGRIIKEL